MPSFAMLMRNCKQSTKITTSLLKSSGELSRRRYATTLVDYKITWERPQKVSWLSAEKSGDLGINVDVKASDVPEIYKRSSEMKDANDIVKNMFSLKFLPKKKTNTVVSTKIMDIVRRHDNDTTSTEARIASLTAKIYIFRELHGTYPYNGSIKVILKEAIDKRRHYLACLRKMDYRCFEYTLEKLNLVYKPTPEPPTQITRRDSLTRLTESHCDRIMQQKLEAYKMELKAQQKDFYREKAAKLEFIRNEEIALNLQPTVSENELALAKQKAMEYET